MLQLEMDNCQRSLEHRVGLWRLRAETTVGGKQAYAWRQMSQWDTLRSHAKKGGETMESILAKHSSPLPAS